MNLSKIKRPLSSANKIVAALSKRVKDKKSVKEGVDLSKLALELAERKQKVTKEKEGKKDEVIN